MSNVRHCKLRVDDYVGTCFSCKKYIDYGPVAGHFCDYEGKCEEDNHEIKGALNKCTINKYDRLTNKDVNYI